MAFPFLAMTAAHSGLPPAFASGETPAANSNFSCKPCERIGELAGSLQDIASLRSKVSGSIRSDCGNRSLIFVFSAIYDDMLRYAPQSCPVRLGPLAGLGDSSFSW